MTASDVLGAIMTLYAVVEVCDIPVPAERVRQLQAAGQRMQVLSGFPYGELRPTIERFAQGIRDRGCTSPRATFDRVFAATMAEAGKVR